MKHSPMWGGTRSEGDSCAPVMYDIANNRLMAQFDGVGGVHRYSVAGRWKVLKDGSWYTGWTVNGKPAPLSQRKIVSCCGKKQRIEYDDHAKVQVAAELFSHLSENALFAVYEFHNEQAASVQIDLHFGFEIDTASYHMEKLRTEGHTATLTPQLHVSDERLFTYSLAEDYTVYFAANDPLTSFEHEDNRFQLRVRLSVEPGEKKRFVWLLSGACGSYTLAQAEADIADWQHHATVVDEENQWLRETFESQDAELNAMYGYCLSASLSSYKDLGESFKGYFAGIDYQSPPRTYFRDGYWTLLASLPYRPEWVRGQIVTLAHGIGVDGQCPSAVIYNQDSGKYEPFWPDHFDSPSFFALIVHDYLSWTNDYGVLSEQVNGRTVKVHMEQAIAYLSSRTSADYPGLALKPDHRRDWVDNVYREGYVTYDLTLYCRALYAVSAVCRASGDEAGAERYAAEYETSRNSLRKLLQVHGYFNYMNTSGFVESNTSIELALLPLFDLCSADETAAIMQLLTTKLETRNNNEQQYGDWGVMTVFPFYLAVHHQVEKSMAPYRYHNGSDWPYLDGIYALAKLRNNDDGWRYPLTRWFQVSLDNGWLTPVEYYGPVYGKGSNLQGWSAMPAAAMLMGGIGFMPSLEEQKVRLSLPPWGDCTFKHIQFRGHRYTLAVTDGVWKVKCEDDPAHEHPFITE
ncbi:hypothetical protein [Paenibacillus sp. OV219]|uniref:hypothetical protein n=1 Tax=Paenibacillus sp. OV219 TaxID=1884377 RepID=UPI0008D04E0F|nr:hypothetical protein [Paenibacillus sp. OV219]SEO02096.1 Glycogen debranching enzyme (alpha-1,6-glucosidase) [Paenibacillus sp. OV219]